VNVYVESNFPLELARQQAEAPEVERILQLADERRIQLIFPASASTEPFSTLMYYGNRRARTLTEFTDVLADLGRSRPYQTLVSNLEPFLANLAVIKIEEVERLEETIERMLRVGRSIPLTAQIFGYARWCKQNLGLSAQDAIMYASVLGDLAPATTDNCFVSRNSSDFGVLKASLEEAGCRYFAHFPRLLEFLNSQVGP
jgi:hypothetical protein